MKLRHDEFQGADLFGRVESYRDTSPIVLDADDVVLFQDYQDIGTVSLECFIH